MKTTRVCFKIEDLARIACISMSSLLAVTFSVTALANPAQIASLVEEMRVSRACENVTVAVTCFGDESCNEAIRQKREALVGFSAAGVHVEPVFNPWKMVLRKNEALNEMVLVPYDSRAHSLRAQRPHVAYYNKSDLACANALALALSVSAGDGPHSQVPALIPTVLSSLQAPKGYISYSWTNAEVFGPR